MAEEALEIRNPAQALLLRDRVVELYALQKKRIRAVAAEAGISEDQATLIIKEELRAAIARRISNQDLLLEAEKQWQESVVDKLQERWDLNPAKLKILTQLTRGRDRLLFLDGIRVTQATSSPAVQVNVNNGPRFDYTGASDAELAEMAALEVELVREGTTAPPMPLEGPGAG